MQTECSTTLFEFAPVEDRKVVADFGGGTMTSNAGALLLGGVDKAVKLVERAAGCFIDRRDPTLIEHSVATLVGQRIFGLALGYEDLNDHDALRHDPLFAVLAGKLKARRADCAPVAGKSTLNRLERSKETPSLYHKIARRSRDCWLICFSSLERARPTRSSLTWTRPTIRCTAGRKAGSSTATTTAIVICRCMSSAATSFWSPNCARPTSTRARERPMKLRG